MSAGVLSYLRQLLPTAGVHLTDAELLRRFTATGEPAAFTELLRRHGPLVWGVCRGVLGDAPAAEDAFQATFLQLARRAAALGRDGSLAAWLHTVARRLAGRAWRAEERRRRRDRSYQPPRRASADELTWRELRQMLDREIARLPDPYRQPLVLCYLESRSQAEAACLLGLSLATLRGRLERGRQTLRRRLEHLGLPLAAALLLTKADPVPAALKEATLRTIGRALAGGPVPPAVASLAADGTLLSRIKIGAVAMILLVAGGVGLGGANRRAEPGAPPPSNDPPAQVQRGVDALGDPLPPGALRRLGTRRHRVQTWPLPWQDLPDGKSYLALQRRGGASEVRRLDAVTGRVLETWPVPPMRDAVGFSPDGRYLLLANRLIDSWNLRPAGQIEKQEWALTLYDLAKRKAVWEKREALERKDWKQVFWNRFSADGRWIATTGGTGEGPLRLWDGRTGKELWSRQLDVPHALPLGFAEGGATLVVRAVDDNSIRLFDRATGKQRRSSPTMDYRKTQQFDLSPDGSAVLFGTYGPTVRVWDIATGKERPALTGHKQWARRFAFSPDGKTLITGGNDPFVLLRAWPSGEVVRTIDLGRGVDRMAVSGDGRRLEVLFWGEQALHFYDLKTGKEQALPVDGHRAGVSGVALAPEGRLLSFGKDATVRTWDPASGKTVARLPVEQDLSAGGFAVSGDGRLLATSDSSHNAVDVYERATGKRVRRLPAELTLGKRLVFSPDGHWLAGSNSTGGTIQVWDVTGGRVVLKLQHKVVYGVTCAFSPNGRQFAAAGEGLVRFWDTGTWKEQAALAASAPLGLAYSPDGRTLATASVEGIRLFELVTRRERAHIRLNDYPGGILQFSSTGRWLAWANGRGAIRVWDVHRGALLASFTGHDDAITGLAFTADDRALASSSEDSTLLLWDIAGTAATKPPPKAGDVEQAWRALAGDDAKAAGNAIRALASSPDAAVRRLARHLKPIAPADRKRIDTCLRDLDSDRFEVRDRATRELEEIGDQAVPALERYLKAPPSLETRRRAEQLLEKARDPARDPERLRQVRALEVLEWIGDDEARRLVESLTRGGSDAGLTRDAQAALRRMRRR